MGTHTAGTRPVLTIFLAFVIFIGATGLPEARGQDEIDFSLTGEYRARGYFFNHFLDLINVHRISIHEGGNLRTFNLSHLNVYQGESLFSDFLVQVFKKILSPAFIFLHNFLFSVKVILTFE